MFLLSKDPYCRKVIFSFIFTPVCGSGRLYPAVARPRAGADIEARQYRCGRLPHLVPKKT